MLTVSCMVWLPASKLQGMVSLVWPDQPKHQHSRGLLVDLVTPDLQGQFYDILPPKAGICVSWIPILLHRAHFVGTTCEMYDVIQKCLPATTNDNITSHCDNGWSQFSFAGGSIWQWELKRWSHQASVRGHLQCWHESLAWAQTLKSLPCNDT